MALNQDFQFSTASSAVRRAFNGTPKRVSFEPPTLICRFAGSEELVGPKGISPWWLFVETTHLPSGQVVDGMNLYQERAARLGKSLLDCLRVRATLSAQFNNP